jgi:multidrug efflux pump subunit AcrA (membrane-fusion protein)
MTDARLAYHLPTLDLEAELERLEGRKTALELQARARLREARAEGSQADLKALSAELRTVKQELAVARAQLDGGACSVCGSDKWLVARFVRNNRTICGPCMRKIEGRQPSAPSARPPSLNAQPTAAHTGNSQLNSPQNENEKETPCPESRHV